MIEERLSVIVSTHIVNANTEWPYLNNDMLYATLLSSHEKMGLEDTKYYLYIDKVMEKEFPELFKVYLNNIEEKVKNDLNHINIDIVMQITT